MLFIIDEEFTVLYRRDCFIAMSSSPRSKGNGSDRNKQAMIPIRTAPNPLTTQAQMETEDVPHLSEP